MPTEGNETTRCFKIVVSDAHGERWLARMKTLAGATRFASRNAFARVPGCRVYVVDGSRIVYEAEREAISA